MAGQLVVDGDHRSGRLIRVLQECRPDQRRPGTTQAADMGSHESHRLDY
jgi:hypothetical protein